MTNFAKADAYPRGGPRRRLLHGRISAPSIWATGQFYLMTIVDKDGQPLRRRQHVSPDRAGECARDAVLVGDGLRPRRRMR